MLVTCRDPGRGQAACDAIQRQVPGASTEVLALDLADLDSAGRLAELILGRATGLDLLINNAAHDAQLADRLWEASETLTGVTFPGLPPRGRAQAAGPGTGR